MTTNAAREDLGTRAALREVVAGIQRLDVAQRRLLEHVWRDGRDLAAQADQPGLACIYDSLQAVVLQLRQAQGEAP